MNRHQIMSQNEMELHWPVQFETGETDEGTVSNDRLQFTSGSGPPIKCKLLELKRSFVHNGIDRRIPQLSDIRPVRLHGGAVKCWTSSLLSRMVSVWLRCDRTSAGQKTLGDTQKFLLIHRQRWELLLAAVVPQRLIMGGLLGGVVRKPPFSSRQNLPLKVTVVGPWTPFYVMPDENFRAHDSFNQIEQTRMEYRPCLAANHPYIPQRGCRPQRESSPRRQPPRRENGRRPSQSPHPQCVRDRSSRRRPLQSALRSRPAPATCFRNVRRGEASWYRRRGQLPHT